jgi:hypothetical protein
MKVYPQVALRGYLHVPVTEELRPVEDSREPMLV